ncbi:hypothetical protein BpKM376_45130 [Burkholderia pseudomallei]|nr:hypothetical protein GTC019_45400 [Burkholderia pseudomallei]BEH27370.1 hypothetical protein GTC050_46220 [Burkholderia pseudomallei]BEH33396.1 hypothetical protein GTC054_46120 [Burkholderia pseudomallei]BEH39412.1 hypothetical protein GTC254T_45070 [Burkholderia pseudomallei]BEH57334.1 hypothetical protein BpKM376_45130 [Burkholderia pseudomallei]
MLSIYLAEIWRIRRFSRCPEPPAKRREARACHADSAAPRTGFNRSSGIAKAVLISAIRISAENTVREIT